MPQKRSSVVHTVAQVCVPDPREWDLHISILLMVSLGGMVRKDIHSTKTTISGMNLKSVGTQALDLRTRIKMVKNIKTGQTNSF